MSRSTVGPLTDGRGDEGVDRSPWPLVGRAPELAGIERFVDGADGSIVFCGPAGTGKTRLLGEVERRAAEAGQQCVRVVASQSAATVPLGAFASVLPAPTLRREAPSNLIGDAVAFFADRGERPGDDAPAAPATVLVVDDAHLLDGASSALVQQLAVGGLVRVAASIRSGEPVPDAITSLWKDLGAIRVDVGPLSRAAVDELVAAVLGSTAGATIDLLWRACAGNPLYLRELVLGAIDSASLVPDARGWRVAGSLVRSPRLVELVEARLAGLSSDQRDVLELLAVSGPIGLPLLVTLVSPDAAGVVERRGLAVTTTDGRRRELQLAHPLHGEVLRAQMPSITAMGINRRLASAVEQLGARRRDDIVRVAVWRLEGGGVGQPDVLLLAATHAHAARNEILAERLARAAVEAGAGPDATLLLGVVLGELGRLESLDLLLTDLAERDDLDDRTRALVACKRAINLLWGMHLPDQAAHVLDEAEASLPEGPARDEVIGERAVLAVLSGRPDRALALAAPLRDAPDPRVSVRAALSLAQALRLSGRPADALAVADRGWAQQNALVDSRGLGSAGIHVIFRLSVMTEVGDVHEAEALAAAAVQVTEASGDAMGIAWAQWVAGTIALDAGRPQESGALHALAEAGWDALGQVGPARWATTGRLFAAVTGDDPGAVAAIEARLAAGDAGGMAIEETSARRALAWAAWTRGDARTALDRLDELVDDALGRGAVLHAVQAAHDLARLGAGAAAHAAWSRLPSPPDWPMGEARARHIGALAAADGKALVEASEELEALGWMLFAAEAAAQAAGVHRRAREARAADRAAARAARLLATCGRAMTPALAEVGDAASLSSREREIAGLAARGSTNRAVADRLGLSERTVENHLQRAYVKLGISARADLADALRLADAGGPGPSS